MTTNKTRLTAPHWSKSFMIFAILGSILAGCAPIKAHIPANKERFPESVPSGLLDFKQQQKKTPIQASALPIRQRLALSNAAAAKLYSFKAVNQPLRVVLSQFAQVNHLNILFNQDVAGMVNVEFNHVTLEQAFSAIVDPIGVGWVKENGFIRIVRQITRTYQVNYLSSVRVDTSSINSTSSAAGASGNNSITKTGSIDFWADLETELKSLLKTSSNSDAMTRPIGMDRFAGKQNIVSQSIDLIDGRYTINKITGTVQVTAAPRTIKTIDTYMKRVIAGINRQVYIEVKILDVTLSDNQALGIDWSRIAPTGNAGQYSISTNNTIQNAVGGAAILPSTLKLGYTQSIAGIINNISAAIQALEQQGTVRVLSQPRIRAMNNQAAIIKVGTDRTFYTLKTTITTPANGTPIQTTTEEATQVTEGLVLSVTPQISPDGLISLDVMPVINKIVGVDTSPTGNSNAARVETKQASTLVRVRDNETAVIGGLIQEEDAQTSRRVPVLGEAPLLGNLFKGQYDNKIRRELVIFITPHLI